MRFIGGVPNEEKGVKKGQKKLLRFWGKGAFPINGEYGEHSPDAGGGNPARGKREGWQEKMESRFR